MTSYLFNAESHAAEDVRVRQDGNLVRRRTARARRVEAAPAAETSCACGYMYVLRYNIRKTFVTFSRTYTTMKLRKAE